MLTLLIGFLFFIIGCLGGKLFFRQMYGITGNDLIEMLSYFYPAAFTVVQNMLIFQYSAYYRNCFNTKITRYLVALDCHNLEQLAQRGEV